MKLLNLNKYIFVFIVLLLFNKTIAQQNDTLILDQQIDSIYLSKNDSEFVFFTTESVLKKSELLNYKRGIAAATQLKGYLFFKYGNFESAKEYLYKAYELNKELKDDILMAQNLRLLAVYLDGVEKYNEALEYLLQSISLRKKIGDEKGIAECYISLGIIYHRIVKIQSAIFYYNKALSYFKKVNNEGKISTIYSNLGAAYNQSGKLDSALLFLKKVVVYKQKLNDKIGLGKAYHNIGTTYNYLGKYEESVDYYNKAIESAGGGESNSNNGISYEAAGISLIKLKRFEEAKKYLNISKDIYIKNNLSNMLVSCYENLSLLYESQGDYKNSIKYLSLGNFMKDSVQKLQDQTSFAEIEAKYKAIEKTYENELLTTKNKLLENETKYNKVLMSCLILMVILSIFLAYNLRTVRKTKNELYKQYKIVDSKNHESDFQNNKLTNLVEENQILMGVLAHDLRSPLVKISGLINLIDDEESNSTDKLEYVNYIQVICRDSLQLIKDTIDLSEIFNEKNADFSVKKERFKAIEIINDIKQTFIANALEKGIEILIVNEQNNIEIYSSKVHLNRILDNLLSNAIKFSPPNSIIQFKVSSNNNKAVFSIKDEGPGFTDLDKKQVFMRFKKLSAKPTGNEASSGLGLYIVKQLTELVGGNISIISEIGKGAEIVLEIPMETT